MEIVNKKGVTDQAYIAGLYGKQVGWDSIDAP